jgi:DNA-binding NarL/FixJ family response regulator
MMRDRTIHIEIVEDDGVASDLLREYLKSDQTIVSAVYTSGEEALERIGQGKEIPQIVLMDIKLPGISGIETTRRLKAEHPGLEIVVLTIHEDAPTIVEAIKAGASAYLLKGASRDEIIIALNEVLNGGSFLTGRVARRLLQKFRTLESGESGAFGLTEREEEILKELVHGGSYKEIAFKLKLSVHTVNNHIRRIYEKMQVHSRGEATAKLRYLT